jgi:hypothetical protein
MNGREIVEKYLRENGYDGLCGDECGCLVDDLMPCGETLEWCEPGYKVPCDEDNCPVDGKCDWHVSPTREEKSEKL